MSGEKRNKSLHQYTRQELVDICYQLTIAVSRDFLHNVNIPDEISRAEGSPGIVLGSARRRRTRKQKRGCRSGMRLKLKRLKRLTLPSLYVTNARSICLQAKDLDPQPAGSHYVRDCCVLIITETWDIPDARMQLAGRSLHSSIRSGGLCVSVHEDWCSNSTTLASHCSPHIEFMSVRCRPYFLPRELTVVMITAVFMPPDADAGAALSLLLDAISSQQQHHPHGAHIIAGNFNRANLQTVLPRLHQHVMCPSRGGNAVGHHVYSNMEHGYRAIALPGPRQADCFSLLLIPAYTPLSRSTPIIKTVTTWPGNALSELQDCFKHTDWGLFEHQDLETFTGTVLDYIKFCVGTVAVDKTIWVFPNQKPWMTRQVRSLLKARDSAFRSGDTALYSATRSELKRGIKKAKEDYRSRAEPHLSTAVDLSEAMTKELSCFFDRFESPQRHSSAPDLPSPSGPSTPLLTMKERDVRRVLQAVDPRDAAGPDGVPGIVLKACAHQLCSIFCRIFNLSLEQQFIPTCLKSKHSPISDSSDCLTPVIMKCFEKLVLQHIKDCLPPRSTPSSSHTERIDALRTPSP